MYIVRLLAGQLILMIIIITQVLVGEEQLALTLTHNNFIIIDVQLNFSESLKTDRYKA